jgi:hypothetical protein
VLSPNPTDTENPKMKPVNSVKTIFFVLWFGRIFSVVVTKELMAESKRVAFFGLGFFELRFSKAFSKLNFSL